MHSCFVKSWVFNSKCLKRTWHKRLHCVNHKLYFLFTYSKHILHKKNCTTNVPKKQQQMLKASWPSILCRINQDFGWKLDWHHAKSKTEAKQIVSRQAMPFYVIFNQISKNMQNFLGVLLNVRLKLNVWTWPRQVSGYIYQWVFQSNHFLTFLSAYFKPVGNSVMHI